MTEPGGQQDRVSEADELIKEWARDQRNDSSELRRLLFPAVASGMEMATSNYAVSEDDHGACYERLIGEQTARVDAAMADLSEAAHWAWWVICKRQGLGHGGVWRYERLAPGGRILPGVYSKALLELWPILKRRGLVA